MAIYITTPTAGMGAGEVINPNNSLTNWTNANTIISVYFRMATAGSVTVGLNASLPAGDTKAPAPTSTVKVTIHGTPFNVQLAGTAAKTYPVGTVNVAVPGYVIVTLQGVAKNGRYFGNVSGLSVTTKSVLNYADDPANYYWSRRDPSVHINYNVAANTEYFYNEVTVPVGEDTISSYFMTAGFDDGYSGMQLKSATERWIIFSVWDANNGQKTTLESQGAGVVDNSFSGEGTGGHSHLVFNWVVGNTYKFITRIRPDGNTGDTLYSAWFFAPENKKWSYFATWRRPATNTYQTGVHSFLENFDPVRGYLWAVAFTTTISGHSTPKGLGQKLLRVDSLVIPRHPMRNAWTTQEEWKTNNSTFEMEVFFADNVTLNQNFDRPATGQKPTVDVGTLPVM